MCTFLGAQSVSGAVESAWIADAIRNETIFDRAAFVPYDRKSGRSFRADEHWAKQRLKDPSLVVGFEVRMARFPSEAHAGDMVMFRRLNISTGGAEFPDRSGVADQVVVFGGDWILVRRRDIVFELFADSPTDTNTLFEAVRIVVEKLDTVRAELDRENKTIRESKTKSPALFKQHVERRVESDVTLAVGRSVVSDSVAEKGRWTQFWVSIIGVIAALSVWWLWKQKSRRRE